jgi:hypothetical protein
VPKRGRHCLAKAIRFGVSQVEVRAATPDDHAAIDALAVEAWQVLQPGYDPARWDELLVSIGKMSTLSIDGRLLVATTSEQVSGAVGYMPPGCSNPKISVGGCDARAGARRPPFQARTVQLQSLRIACLQSR